MVNDIRYAVEPGWTTSLLLQSWPDRPVRLLFYPDGRIGVEHKCRVLDGMQVVCAPRIQPGSSFEVGLSGAFEVDWTAEDRSDITIKPSIDCPDCALHGFARDGRWIAV